MQQKSPIYKLSQYHIALIFQYLHGAQILSKFSKACKSFYAVAKKELIWRNQCHSVFNFSRRRAELNQTWYDCFIRKCKASIGALVGTANQSFLMTPLRGHQAFITANAIQQDLIISGDNQGVVRAWLLDPSDYQDSDPAQLVIFKFEPWQETLITGAINHQYTRVDKVWILENYDSDDALYQADESSNNLTVIAVSGRQICILKLGIEGFIPPKFIEEEENDSNVKALIKITQVKEISQIDVIKRKIKSSESDNQNSSKKFQNILVVAPDFGYVSPYNAQPKPQAKLLLIDLESGQKLALIDLAQGLAPLTHKQPQPLHQPQLPGAFQPWILAVHQQFLKYYDQVDKKFKQLIKLNNRQELCYCLNNGIIQKINLSSLKIIKQNDTKILRNNDQVVFLSLGQDAVGSYIYAITHCNVDGQYELMIICQNSLKVLCRTNLEDIGIANLKSSYFRIEVCKLEIDDKTKGELQIGQVDYNGNLVVLLLGGVFFSCFLHTTQQQAIQQNENQEEMKQNNGQNLTHALIKVKKDKKKKSDFQRNLYNLQQLAKYGTVFDFNVFKRKNIVTAHSQDILKVSKIRTGEEIFVLRGGSKMSHPKSYVKNPQRDGFAYCTISQDKIVGVRGNLIRVFSFDV